MPRALITASSDQLWVGRSDGTWKSTTSREGRKKASKIRYFDDCFLLQQFQQGMREQEAGKCGRKFSVNTTHHAAFATTIIASPPLKILNSIAYFDRCAVPSLVRGRSRLRFLSLSLFCSRPVPGCSIIFIQRSRFIPRVRVLFSRGLSFGNMHAYAYGWAQIF